jgi:hypothetical protein
MMERPGAGPPQSPLMSGSSSKYGRATTSFVASHDLRPCRCGVPRCPVFLIEPRAAFVMDNLRERILHEFGRVAPGVPRLRRRP